MAEALQTLVIASKRFSDRNGVRIMPWKILIVDDEGETCANLSDILTDFGHEVCTAHNARDALQRADEQRFDIVLLDLQMPGMDGVDLSCELKRPAPTAVAILNTGLA